MIREEIKLQSSFKYSHDLCLQTQWLWSTADWESGQRGDTVPRRVGPDNRRGRGHVTVQRRLAGALDAAATRRKCVLVNASCALRLPVSVIK